MNVIAHNSAISACEKGEQWSFALGLLRELRRQEHRPDRISHNSLATACEKSSLWEFAGDALAGAAAGASATDLVAHNVATSAAARAGRWALALECLSRSRPLFRRDGGSSWEPDIVSFVTAVSAAEKGQQWRWALQLLGAMSCCSLRPGSVGCNAALLACCGSAGAAGQKWAWALRLLAEMAMWELEVEALNYGKVLGELEQQGLLGREDALISALGMADKLQGGVHLKTLAGRRGS